MRVPIRDLRNDTRAVIDAVERGVEVVLTRRGHPIARIVPIEPDDDDLAAWIDEITAKRKLANDHGRARQRCEHSSAHPPALPAHR